MNVIQKVRSIVEEIRSGKKPSAFAENWALAGRLLSRMTSDQARIGTIVSAKDLEALSALVTEIENKAVSAAATQAAIKYLESDMNAALKAFHKRMSLGRLADESKLGGRYTSGGKKSDRDAIQPPEGFPPGIWDALVRAGKLKDMGQGFYAEI